MNELKLSLQQSILALNRSRWSARAIARELGINRETVAKYLRTALQPATDGLAAPPVSKPAISTPGSDDGAVSKPAISTAGSTAALNSNPGISTPGPTVGRKSLCEQWQEEIELALDGELSAQRIYQDLVAKHQFTVCFRQGCVTAE